MVPLNAVIMCDTLVPSMTYIESLELVGKVPSKFAIRQDGQMKKENISMRTPVGDGYNFDEIM